MSKAVLISIRPEWCKMIANGEKTVEVRKTIPKLKPPFKCYIYCTNARPYLVWGDVFRGDWVTEFTTLYGYNRKNAEKIGDVFNGKVIGEFICIGILFYLPTEYPKLSALSRVSIDELYKYAGDRDWLYGWLISNVVIYDEPKELSEFHLARPPQSWCYVEEQSGES